MSIQLSPPQPQHTESTLVSRGMLFEEISQSLQLNQYHLPDYIYRADLIPLNYKDYPPEQRVNILNGAAMELTFQLGYPALKDGTPFWEQLPSESSDAYNAFISYLELPEKSNHDNPLRLLPMIAELTQIPFDDIKAYFNIYYWSFRSRAYDLFIVACHRKQRELRVMSIEGKHFKMAEELLHKVQTFAHKRLDEALLESDNDDTKLKDLIDMTQKLVQIQRISVGLAAHGTQQIDMGPKYAQTDTIMQHVAKESNSDSQQQAHRSQEMDMLLSNPEDLVAIQDLMVRLHAPKSTSTHSEAGTPPPNPDLDAGDIIDG